MILNCDVGGPSPSSQITIFATSVTFTLRSLISAPLYNIFGHRVIIPSALAYVLYVDAFLSTSYAFTIAAVAILGIGAGFLWTAQAGIMMSYPAEQDKGKTGATIGAVIPVVNEWNSKDSAVKQSTYIAFIVIMTFGALLTLALLRSNKVVRADGSRVSFHKISNWKRETIEVLKLFKDPRMLILIPLFAGSNWFYTYQFNGIKSPGFTSIRARDLNNFLYWLFQIIGAGLFGVFLDPTKIGSRKARAIYGNILNLVIITALWIAAIFIQKGYTRESVLAPDYVKLDITDPKYPGIVVVYALFGVIDAMYQDYIYWLLGTMTNDVERAARYGGFYKTIQNACNAVANQLEAKKVSYMAQLIIVFTINVVGLLLALIVAKGIPDVTIENLEDGHAVGTLVGGQLEDIGDGNGSVHLSERLSDKVDKSEV
ncbi:hypothetical protein MFLAVUS_008485 [Mucor flavus]|uniref:Uncharacterized protein n=1 Tax=Mucor flavus TaxID=439312 RepID=A0ABP9Z7D3_9FUNG